MERVAFLFLLIGIIALFGTLIFAVGDLVQLGLSLRGQ
jgi:hypothetical protein